jgi:hypothetical protein
VIEGDQPTGSGGTALRDPAPRPPTFVDFVVNRIVDHLIHFGSELLLKHGTTRNMRGNGIHTLVDQVIGFSIDSRIDGKTTRLLSQVWVGHRFFQSGSVARY